MAQVLFNSAEKSNNFKIIPNIKLRKQITSSNKIDWSAGEFKWVVVGIVAKVLATSRCTLSAILKIFKVTNDHLNECLPAIN